MLFPTPRRIGGVFLAAATILAAHAAEPPAVSEALRLAGEAMAAAEKEDTATYLAKMEAAAALRPDMPRILSNLAAAQTAAGQVDEALGTLERLAALGSGLRIADTEEFAALRERKEFGGLVKTFAANNRSQGKGDIAFTLRDMTGLIEGIAWREKTDEFYFGDVNGRAIWRRTKDGKVIRLTPEGDDLLGVFGLVIDEAAGAIWAATSAVPAMRGFSPELQGTAALAEIDLETGALRRAIAVPAANPRETMSLLGDLTLAPDGSIYLPDSGEPCIWRLSPGAAVLERVAEHPEFISLQGMVITPAGVAVVADRINGLLRVELATGAVSRFESPPNTTLIGIDGLAQGKGNSLFAVQNGVEPTRVLRIDFDPAVETVRAVTVLEAGHLTMAAPSLGCIGSGGDFYFIGNAGWSHFENDAAPSEPRPVPIFKVSAGSARTAR